MHTAYMGNLFLIFMYRHKQKRNLPYLIKHEMVGVQPETLATELLPPQKKKNK